MDVRLMRIDFYAGAALVARRPVAAAVLEPGERVSEAIRAAAGEFCAAHGPGDVFAWVGRLPGGAEEFAELRHDGGLATLVLAGWVPAGCVVVGRGGDSVVDNGGL